jgi:hypothetical protein
LVFAYTIPIFFLGLFGMLMELYKTEYLWISANENILLMRLLISYIFIVLATGATTSTSFPLLCPGSIFVPFLPALPNRVFPLLAPCGQVYTP